jgi:CRISPR-associated endonuclease Cas2
MAGDPGAPTPGNPRPLAPPAAPTRRRHHRNQRHPITLIQTAAGQLSAAADLKQLNGFEGIAARHYYGALATLIDTEFGFQGRKRRPPPDPFNALLSLGYTLLYQRCDGQRVQYSVFEVHLHKAAVARLRGELRALLGEQGSDVRFYRLTANGLKDSSNLAGDAIGRRELVVII